MARRARRRRRLFLSAVIVILLGVGFFGRRWLGRTPGQDEHARQPVAQRVDQADLPAPQSQLPAMADSDQQPSQGRTASLELLAANETTTAKPSPKAKPTVGQVDLPKPKPPGTSAAAEQIIRRSRKLSKARQVIKARKLLNTFLEKSLDQAGAQTVVKTALELGNSTILGPKTFDNDPLCYKYRVEAGDTLGRLAKRCKVPYRFLARINGIDDPRRLRAGQIIKLVNGPFDARVVKSQVQMYVYLQNTLVCRFPIGLGKQDGTPTGQWLVEDCVKNPPYVDPDSGRYYAPNDPDNPTGGYWIRLKGLSGQAVGKTGYGIHGTTDQKSVGRYLSRGCVRLGKNDVALLYDMLYAGISKIQVVP